jgi:mitogen-activated protein kinase organizer 1
MERVSGEVQTYLGHGQAVYDAATTKDNARIASCGGDKQVRRRRGQVHEGGTLLSTLVGQCPELRRWWFDSGRCCWVRVLSLQVFYWDVSTGRTIRRFRGHDSAVNSITFGATETVLVTAGYDQVR